METSPTGTPVIPPKVIPWIGASLGVLAGLGQLLQLFPSHTIAARAGALIASQLNGGAVVGALLGLLSPGLRKSGPQA